MRKLRRLFWKRERMLDGSVVWVRSRSIDLDVVVGYTDWVLAEKFGIRGSMYELGRPAEIDIWDKKEEDLIIDVGMGFIDLLPRKDSKVELEISWVNLHLGYNHLMEAHADGYGKTYWKSEPGIMTKVIRRFMSRGLLRVYYHSYWFEFWKPRKVYLTRDQAYREFHTDFQRYQIKNFKG